MGTKVGEAIALRLQTFNGATNLFPLAKLRNPANALLQTVSLTHVADGLYAPASDVLMPNEAFVVAQYFCYTDSGHTVLDLANSRASERFDLEQVFAGSNGELSAEIDNSELEAKIDSLEVSC